MAGIDWSATPVIEDLVEDFITGVRTRDEHNATMDYTDDTGLPTGTVRYNRTSEHFEEFDSASWAALPLHALIEDHLADEVAHSGVPTGGIIMYGGTITGQATSSPPPATWYWCNGDAVSRTTDADLFTIVGTTFGTGDGSTTFNLPDFRQRIPMGKAASGTGSTLGGTLGSIDHTHTGPSHTHTMNSHTHTMGNHTHTGPSHSHTIPNHTHLLPAHYHAATGNGADINIAASGAHVHSTPGRPNGAAGSDNQFMRATNIGNATNLNSNSATHTHSNSDFAGRVGNVTSGNNGDSVLSSGDAVPSGQSTGLAGTGATGAPSTNTTDGTVATMSASGTGATGSNNPPCLVVNFIIKR